MDIGGAGKSVNQGGSEGMHPQIILISRTPESLGSFIFFNKSELRSHFSNLSILLFLIQIEIIE